MLKPPFKPGHWYTESDLRAILDYYNETYSTGKSNYLQMEVNRDAQSARVYVTGKYDFHQCYGIKRYQSNLYSFEGVPARDPRNFRKFTALALELLTAEGEDNVRACLKYAEEMPALAQALSGDDPPPNEPHTDWKYKYHYPHPLAKA